MTSPIRSLALASALLAVLAACSKPEQPQMPPPEVVVVTATPKDVPLQRDLVGRLSPYRSSDVRARVAGVVQKRVYQEGSDVKEGQVLFLIDPAPLQASLSAAQANLASAQATYANAKVAADRARQLAPQKFVSRSDLDNAEAAERSAAAAVQQARANVETARINLGYASVTAPIAGRAGKQQVTEGALVGQGDTTLLTTINQIDPLYANFSMSSSELQAIQQAQGEGKVELASAGQRTVQIVLPNGRALDRTGTLDFSDTVVDPATGSVSLRATVPNADRALLPGTFVTLRATLGQHHHLRSRLACCGHHGCTQARQQRPVFAQGGHRIMVAAEQQQGHASAVQPHHQLAVQLARIARRRAGVENIAGNQYRIHCLRVDLQQ